MSFKIKTLNNGIQVISEKIEHIKSVSLGVWCLVGAINEKEHNSGISHFIEHMAFRGTGKRDSREIANAMESIGGYMNAYTGREMTAYYCQVMHDNIDIAADIVIDNVIDSLFKEEDIEKEKSVVLQEISKIKDTPEDYVFDLASNNIFPDYKGRPIIGTKDIVQSLTRDQIIEYFKKHYVNSRLVVSGSGYLDHENFEGIIEQKIGHYHNPQSEEEKHKKSEIYVPCTHMVTVDSEQCHIVMNRPSIGGKSSPTYYAEKVYGSILGGGFSSKLFQQVREKKGYCYSVFAGVQASKEYGSMNIYVGTTKGKDSINAIYEVLDEDINQEELDRAKAKIISAYVMSQESSFNRANKNAYDILNYGAIQEYAEIYDKITSLSLDDIRQIQSFYNKTIDEEKSWSITCIGPSAQISEIKLENK